MPTYNRGNKIINSIKSALSQTHKHIELIIIDDRSTDNTADIIKQLELQDTRIKYFFNNGKKGVSGARNLGIKIAKGDFIAFLDDDDIFYPTKIEKQLGYFANNNIDCLISGIPNSLISQYSGKKWIELEFKPYMLFHPCKLMCTAASMKRVSFRGQYMEWRDLAFQLFLNNANVYLSSEFLFRINRSTDSLSRQEDNMLTAALENALLYYDLTVNLKEHWIFKRYLSICYKNIANFSLKQGKIIKAIKGYINAYKYNKSLSSLIPFKDITNSF